MKTVTKKPCARCKRVLSASAFPPNPKLKSGLHSYCHECRKAKNNERRKSHRNSNVEKACTACERVLSAEHFMSNVNSSDGLRSRCRDCSSSSQTLRKYNLTADRYAELARDGCHVCGSHEKLQVDHDHSCCSHQGSCGQCVRGVLCWRHNNGLGCFLDDPAALRAAADYLERHQPA